MLIISAKRLHQVFGKDIWPLTFFESLYNEFHISSGNRSSYSLLTLNFEKLGLDVIVTVLMCFLSFFRETVQPSLVL